MKAMFSTELRYNVVILEDARSVAMTSFFSHGTVSHLDLQISRRALLRSGHDRRLPSLEKSFFCTEESLRKSLVPQRRLLYSLNLDFPEAREYSNSRSGSAPMRLPCDFKSLFVAISGWDGFFKKELVGLIEIASKQTDCRFELLKWMADFRPLESAFIPISVQNSCAIILHRESADSKFTMKFFEKFIRVGGLSRVAELKAFEYLLYHAKMHHFDLRGKSYCSASLTDFCIQFLSLRCVHSFLKFEDTAYYTEEAYERYKRGIFHNRMIEEEEMSIPENHTSKSRLFRMIQIIHMFRLDEFFYLYVDEFHRPDASEALRLIWRSIPDCFVTLREMMDAYGPIFSAEVVRRAHSFYEEVIGQTVPRPEPRPLTHYCRTLLRKCLHHSKQWLPDGIERLELPPGFAAFLNLERDDLRPENFHSLQQTASSLSGS